MNAYSSGIRPRLTSHGHRINAAGDCGWKCRAQESGMASQSAGLNFLLPANGSASGPVLRVVWAALTPYRSAMSAPAPIAPADPVRDLASRIFVELVCRNVVVTDSAAEVKCNPENLARISFKLADAFQRVDVAIKAPSMPKNQEFDMKAASLPGWEAEVPK